MFISSVSVRMSTAAALVVISASLSAAQGRSGGSPPAGVVNGVRTALGHGDVAEAGRLAEAGSPAASRDLALALVDIFQGRDDEARPRLQPLAAAAPLGDAAVELGLLELRHGHRDLAQKLFAPIVANRTFNGPDDYLRLGLAAQEAREFLLAGDAFIRVADVPRADIQTAWGDLFLRRHQPGDAMTSYKKAIELDPKWVRAYVGAARALRDEDAEAAGVALDEAAKIAPDHPDLWLVRAEERLENEDKAGAREALDRLAAVRPGTIDEAALRVAIAYEEGGIAAVEPALGAVRAIDPTSALGLRRAGEQAARDYRSDEAAALARQAIALDPDDAAAAFDLGLYLMRTGDEAGARATLERSWDLDKSNRVTKNLLDLLDTLDTFDIVPDGPLVFKFAKNESKVLSAYALPLGETAYKTFVDRYGYTPRGPILIEVFTRHDDFAVRTLGLPGLVGALGACFGRVISMDSPSAPGVSPFSWQATLWHEMAHVFTLQLSDYRVPRWLTEGISVFEEHRRQPAWGRELTLEYARAMALGKTFGVKGLPDAFKHPESLALAYFEASLVVEHLVDQHGDEGLRTLLKAYGEGATDSEAFARAFGTSLDQADASFKAFVTARYGALAEAMKTPPAVAPDDLNALRTRAAAAPGNFVSQWSYGQALVQADRDSEAVAPLERAATLAPEASGGSSPRALLAEIARKRGDNGKARRELRALLTYDHTNIAAARELVTLSSDPGAIDDRDYGLRLVADLDPFDAGAHSLLGRRLMQKGDAASALVEFRAALALGPTNLAEAHADVAEVLLALERRDEAKQEALAALKEAPTYARAQDLLLAAIGRTR